MEQTWKPTTAGILNIISGAIGLVFGILCGVLGISITMIPGIPAEVIGILGGIAIPLIILGIIAIVGGVYALKRSKWGLALAGSICSLFCLWILGILAIIFVAMGRNEFE